MEKKTVDVETINILLIGNEKEIAESGLTPAAFAASCNPPGSATLRLPDCRIKNVDNSLIKVGT